MANFYFLIRFAIRYLYLFFLLGPFLALQKIENFGRFRYLTHNFLRAVPIRYLSSLFGGAVSI